VSRFLMEDQAINVEVACKICGQVHAMQPLPPGTIAKCSRCGSTITQRTSGSHHLTAAFSLAALILYFPANVLPILELHMYGATTQNTVWEGTVRLFKDGDTIIAAIVFCASIVIPLLKLMGLFFLVITTRFHFTRWKVLRTWVFRIIDTIGRWAMLDVFVVAILVSLVKLQRLATIIAGPGLLAFSLVVVFTLFASASFDSQLIWEQEEVLP
jgi:paraquat-inducible protein A